MNQPAADNLHQVAAIRSRQDIDTLYTPLHEALAQLNQRRSDRTLQEMVTKFFCTNPPRFLRDEPQAFISRSIITPNREFELFTSTIRTIDMSSLCLEYTADILDGRNRDKYRLCHPVFEVRTNHYQGLRKMNFIPSPGQSFSQRLCDFTVKNGVRLPEFHHALLRKAAPEMNGNLHDYSSWFSMGCRQECFYLHYLALFLRDGILFENFFADDLEELRFARERVIPSFTKAVELFGVRPLIVRLLPRESECDEYWRSHDGALYAFAVNLLRQRHAADS